MNLVDDVGKNVSSLYRYKSNGKKKKAFSSGNLKWKNYFVSELKITAYKIIKGGKI